MKEGYVPVVAHMIKGRVQLLLFKVLDFAHHASILISFFKTEAAGDFIDKETIVNTELIALIPEF